MVPISLILRSGLRTSEVPGSFRVLYWYREIHLGIYGLQIILLYSSISHLSLPFFFLLAWEKPVSQETIHCIIYNILAFKNFISYPESSHYT